MISPRFSALKTRDGWFKVLNEDQLKAYLSRLPDQLSLVLQPLKRSRSNEQNRYYWGCLLKIISDETGNSPEDMHEFLKAKFLRKWILIRGIEAQTVKSTTELTTKEFEEYLDQCRQWASMELSIFIPLPNDAEY